MLEPDTSFSPVKSPKKKKSKHSSETSNFHAKASFPSNAIYSYLLIKIKQNINEEDDFIVDSMMDTVQSILKVILPTSKPSR